MSRVFLILLHGTTFAFNADLFLVAIVFGFALINAVAFFSADLSVGAITCKAATDELFATARRKKRHHGQKQHQGDPANRSCHQKSLRSREKDGWVLGAEKKSNVVDDSEGEWKGARGKVGEV